MSEENNMFGNNGQQEAEPSQSYSQRQEAEQPQSYSQMQEAEQPQSYGQQQNYNQEPQSYSQQQDYNQQPQSYSQQQEYNQYYDGQNQQTPLSGYAEPVYHNQYNQYNTDSREESQGFGIASLICGILAIVTCCCSCPCAPLAIISIVLGILQISKGTGKGMAIAGIICSAVGLVLMIICLVFTIFLNTSSDLSKSYYRNYYDILQELEDLDYMEDGHHSHTL